MLLWCLFLLDLQSKELAGAELGMRSSKGLGKSKGWMALGRGRRFFWGG